MTTILAEQVGIIALLLFVGVWLGKKEIVSYEAARMFANVTLTVITPVVILRILQRDLRTELFRAFLLAVLMIIVYHIICAVAGIVLFRGKDDDTAIDRIMTVGSNCGYMGIPLITSVLSDRALIYTVAFLVVLNLYIWTGGVMTLQRSGKISVKDLLKNPALLASVAGLVLFGIQALLGWTIPAVLGKTMDSIAQMNTPLPTIVTGVLIANLPLKKLLRDVRIYLVSLARLVLLPLLFLGILLLLRAQTWVADGVEFVIALVICSACPCALSGILMPARIGIDAQRGGALVGVSTVLSIVTIPLVVAVAQYALGI